MNILPQKYNQFKDKKYWDHFFSSLKNTQNQFFQWYGSYKDYKDILQSLIPASSNIFHVGCGKSIFSQQILNNNQKLKLNIVNCDYSQNVIKQMQQRCIKNKISMQYVVCDLFQPLEQRYHHKFDIVLDKGTLDAMLPQDTPQNVNKIKQYYFKNIQKSLAIDKKDCKLIIISLLQPFVLKTLLEHFGFQSQKFKLEIFESIIVNSKLQPFLVFITLNSTQKTNNILLHRLGNGQIVQLGSIDEALLYINKLQSQINYGARIKQLIGGRRTKFNIFNQNNRKKLRYILEVVDSQDKNSLSLNNCSVFIVPQGKQNSYLFNDTQGMNNLVKQVGSSRLIFAKLITGNQFKNIEQVKKQLNSIITDFIQKGYDPKKVPYLTDADELGQRRYLFQNQQFIIDEVLIDGQPSRRLFLKSNPVVPQCSFKLTYLSENSHKHLKELSSQILPAKKNLVIGIDKQQLADDYAQYIYSISSALVGHPKNGWKVLIIGCQYALARFLSDNFQASQITLIADYKSTKEVNKYLQIQQNQRLTIVPTNLQLFFLQNPEEKFKIIINCLNEDSSQQNPQLKYAPSNSKIQELILAHLQPAGVYIYQYNNYQTMPNFSQYFFPVYASGSNDKSQNILFCLRHSKQYTKENKLIVHRNLINFKSKSKPDYQWQADNIKDLVMVQPYILDGTQEKKQHIFNKQTIHIQNQSKFEDIYEIQSNQKAEKKVNKKKKKKK